MERGKWDPLGWVPLAGIINSAFQSASQPLFSLLHLWALFATARYKPQTNPPLSVFRSFAKLQRCELPAPICVFNCPGPLLPARPLFSIQPCHLPPPLPNLFVSETFHYFSIPFHCRGPIQGPLKCFHRLQWALNQAQRLCLFQVSSVASRSAFLLFLQGVFPPPLLIQQCNMP